MSGAVFAFDVNGSIHIRKAERHTLSKRQTKFAAAKSGLQPRVPRVQLKTETPLFYLPLPSLNKFFDRWEMKSSTLYEQDVISVPEN